MRNGLKRALVLPWLRLKSEREFRLSLRELGHEDVGRRVSRVAPAFSQQFTDFTSTFFDNFLWNLLSVFLIGIPFPTIYLYIPLYSTIFPKNVHSDQGIDLSIKNGKGPRCGQLLENDKNFWDRADKHLRRKFTHLTQ